MSDAPDILAIDTSSRRGGVALARGDRLLAVRYFQTDYNHGMQLLPTIECLCREVHGSPSSLTAVCLSIGPGSFTGLRIAVTVARTFAAVQSLSVVGVPTLEVIAQNALSIARPPEQLGVILDAKREQVYAAAFQRSSDGYIPLHEAAVCDPADFLNRLDAPRTIMGEGIPHHHSALATADHLVLPQETWLPRVEIVHRLGHARLQQGLHTAAADLRPTYLRRPEAEEVWDRRHPTG